MLASAVDAAPVGTTQPVEPEPPNSQFFFPTCGQTQQGLRSFSGVTVEELLRMEVCAGSVRLTKTCHTWHGDRQSNQQELRG